MMTPKETMRDQSYIGDGLYLGHDGWHIWLYTDNGNAVALNPPVFREMLKAVQRIEKSHDSHGFWSDGLISDEIV